MGKVSYKHPYKIRRGLKTRKFDGKVYVELYFLKTKAEATEKREKITGKGEKARVVKHKDGYSVYYRGPHFH